MAELSSKQVAGIQEIFQSIDIACVTKTSSNQRVRVLNPAFQDQITWASDQIEIHILKDGGRIVTGYQGGLELT